MPMSVKCPECEASYKVADEAVGKAIKCKKCGAKVPVPAADDEDDDDFSDLADKSDSGDAKEKKKGSKTLLIVGIVAAALTCCICLPGGGLVGGYYLVMKPLAEAAKKKVDEADKKLAEEIEKDRKRFDKDEGGATIFTKNDTLTLKDQRVADGRPAKTYKVRLESGKGYIIDMKGSGKPFEYDPYLILLNPQNKKVAEDDDSGGGLDAQIRYTPPATGEHTVQATCFGRGVPPNGLPFSLSVKLAK